MNFTYLKFLLVCLVGIGSFYIIYVLQGVNAALLLISQNMFTATILVFIIDYVKKPEKIMEQINNIKKKKPKDNHGKARMV